MYGQGCMLYAAQFSKHGYDSPSDAPKFIAAGGSGANEARVFDVQNNNACVGSITGLPRGIFTVDWSPTESKVAVAGGDATIRLIDVCAKTSKKACGVLSGENGGDVENVQN